MTKRAKLSPSIVDDLEIMMDRAKAEQKFYRDQFVYLMTTQHHMKIGYTTNVADRLYSMQAHCPLPITLEAYIRGPMSLEWAIQSLIHPLHFNGEWFRRHRDVIEIFKFYGVVREWSTFPIRARENMKKARTIRHSDDVATIKNEDVSIN